MSHRPDEHDLERSHELERRLDRDEEREPYAFRQRRTRRPRYFSRVAFRPAANENGEPFISSPMRQIGEAA